MVHQTKQRLRRTESWWLISASGLLLSTTTVQLSCNLLESPQETTSQQVSNNRWLHRARSRSYRSRFGFRVKIILQYFQDIVILCYSTSFSASNFAILNCVTLKLLALQQISVPIQPNTSQMLPNLAHRVLMISIREWSSTAGHLSSKFLSQENFSSTIVVHSEYWIFLISNLSKDCSALLRAPWYVRDNRNVRDKKRLMTSRPTLKYIDWLIWV